MSQEALQSRLDAVFGALHPPGDQPSAWRPSTEQVFKDGGVAGAEQGASSDEEAEFEERARREVVPGLAMDLATEDEPDEEGFRPSTAFCRALDREEEYTDVDELATGTYRSGREALPPRSMEVLEDNVWEQRIAQRDALRHGGGEAAGAGEQPGQPAAMDTDAAPAEGAAAAERPSTQQAQQGEQEEGRGRARSESQEAENGSQRSSEGSEAAGGQRPALASGARPKGAASKRVRFLGVPEPWVPPHRREGFVPRDPAGAVPPEEGQPAAGPAANGLPAANRRPNQRGIAQSRVPDHVQHPERYTMYTLDEPLLVGGGVGQLGSESRGQLEQEAAAARQATLGEAPADEPEPERWQGTVGGGIEFRPKQRAAGDGPGSARGAATGAAQQGPVRLTMGVEEGEEAGQQAAGGGAAEQHAGDAEMADVEGAAQPQQAAGQFKAARGRSRSGRGYRSKAAAGDEGED